MNQAPQIAVDWWALADVIYKMAFIPLAIAAVLYLAKLVGLKLSAQEKADLAQSVETGLLAAEAKGLAAWKSHGAALAGPEKLSIAIHTARQVSQDGLQKHGDAELVTLTEAALVKARPLLSSPPPPMSERPPREVNISIRPPAG